MLKPRCVVSSFKLSIVFTVLITSDLLFSSAPARLIWTISLRQPIMPGCVSLIERAYQLYRSHIDEDQIPQEGIQQPVSKWQTSFRKPFYCGCWLLVDILTSVLFLWDLFCLFLKDLRRLTMEMGWPGIPECCLLILWSLLCLSWTGVDFGLSLVLLDVGLGGGEMGRGAGSVEVEAWDDVEAFGSVVVDEVDWDLKPKNVNLDFRAASFFSATFPFRSLITSSISKVPALYGSQYKSFTSLSIILPLFSGYNDLYNLQRSL